MAADTQPRGLLRAAVSIAPGKTVRLDVSATVDSSLDSQARLKSAGFQLRLMLTGAGPDKPTPVGNRDVTTGDLPPTGVEVRNGLLLGTAVMTGGIALLLWKRRKERAESFDGRQVGRA